MIIFWSANQLSTWQDRKLSVTHTDKHRLESADKCQKKFSGLRLSLVPACHEGHERTVGWSYNRLYYIISFASLKKVFCLWYLSV